LRQAVQIIGGRFNEEACLDIAEAIDKRHADRDGLGAC